MERVKVTKRDNVKEIDGKKEKRRKRERKGTETHIECKRERIWQRGKQTKTFKR